MQEGSHRGMDVQCHLTYSDANLSIWMAKISTLSSVKQAKDRICSSILHTNSKTVWAYRLKEIGGGGTISR